MSDPQQRILGTILSNLPGLLAIKDKKLAYTVVNPGFCQFLGKGPGEIVGKTDLDLFPQAEAEACAKADQSVLKSGMAKGGELQLTGREGVQWFDTMRAAMLDENGDPAGVMFTAYDVTEFKTREVAVQSAEARIAESEQCAAALQSQLDAQAAAAAQHEAHAAEQRSAVEAMLAEKGALQDQVIEAQSTASQAGQALEQFRQEAAQAQATLQAQLDAASQRLEAAEAQATAAQEGLRQQLKAAEEERSQMEERLKQAAEAHVQAGQLAQQLVNLLQS